MLHSRTSSPRLQRVPYEYMIGERNGAGLKNYMVSLGEVTRLCCSHFLSLGVAWATSGVMTRAIARSSSNPLFVYSYFLLQYFCPKDGMGANAVGMKMMPVGHVACSAFTTCGSTRITHRTPRLLQAEKILHGLRCARVVKG